mmetsp:Transcript_128022/g.286255  ORF Transcript_128022/g.286255 Transcript_128022/m.286255 type:complete len:339 (+) Transcript_128022:1614-2630(+)
MAQRAREIRRCTMRSCLSTSGTSAVSALSSSVQPKTPRPEVGAASLWSAAPMSSPSISPRAFLMWTKTSCTPFARRACAAFSVSMGSLGSPSVTTKTAFRAVEESAVESTWRAFGSRLEAAPSIASACQSGGAIFVSPAVGIMPCRVSLKLSREAVNPQMTSCMSSKRSSPSRTSGMCTCEAKHSTKPRARSNVPLSMKAPRSRDRQNEAELSTQMTRSSGAWRHDVRLTFTIGSVCTATSASGSYRSVCTSTAATSDWRCTASARFRCRRKSTAVRAAGERVPSESSTSSASAVVWARTSRTGAASSDTSHLPSTWAGATCPLGSVSASCNDISTDA